MLWVLQKINSACLILEELCKYGKITRKQQGKKGAGSNVEGRVDERLWG